MKRVASREVWNNQDIMQRPQNGLQPIFIIVQQSNRIYVRPEGTLNRLLRMLDIYHECRANTWTLHHTA